FPRKSPQPGELGAIASPESAGPTLGMWQRGHGLRLLYPVPEAAFQPTRQFWWADLGFPK
ncbi:MAG: hypothetical protein C0467_18010, partial [Planctomycetaceae bacterium]|nr:hypothetical protein [Planctomycetaceae bacterium]